MIYTPHIVVGAVIGAKTQNLGLIIIFAFLSHIILDLIPHYDYSLKKLLAFIHKKKDGVRKKIFIDCLKGAVDILLGLIIVFFILHKNGFFIHINYTHLGLIVAGIFFSTLPDSIQSFFHIFPSKIGLKYTKFHHALHWHNKKKESKITFLNVTTQIVIIIIFSAVLLNL